MALTIGGVENYFNTNWSPPGVSDYVSVRQHDITFDSSYPTGGEAVDETYFGFGTAVVEFIITQPAGYHVEWDKDNEKLKVYQTGNQTPSTNGIVNDDDSAATNGADLQIAVADHTANTVEENALNGLIGRFEAVNAGNADVTDNEVGTATGGPTFTVYDNDNAETETAAMADVYIAPAGGGFYAVTLSGLDTYVPLSNGEFIKVQYDADPASNQTAVQVYYDDDATNAWERLLAVVVDNADETFTVASELSWRTGTEGAGAEVSNTTDLSGLTVRALVLGY